MVRSFLVDGMQPSLASRSRFAAHKIQLPVVLIFVASSLFLGGCKLQCALRADGLFCPSSGRTEISINYIKAFNASELIKLEHDIQNVSTDGSLPRKLCTSISMRYKQLQSDLKNTALNPQANLTLRQTAEHLLVGINGTARGVDLWDDVLACAVQPDDGLICSGDMVKFKMEVASLILIQTREKLCLKNLISDCGSGGNIAHEPEHSLNPESDLPLVLSESNGSIGEDSFAEDDYHARHLLLSALAVAHKRPAKAYFLWWNYKDLTIYKDAAEVVSAFSFVTHQLGLNHLVARIVTGVENKVEEQAEGALEKLATMAEDSAGEAAAECIAGTGGGCLPVLAAGCVIAAIGFFGYVMYERYSIADQDKSDAKNEGMTFQQANVEVDVCEGQVAGDDQVVEKYADFYLKGNVMDTQARIQDIKEMLKIKMEHHQDCVVNKSQQVTDLGTKMAEEDKQRDDDWQNCWILCGPEPERRVPENFQTLSTAMYKEFDDYRGNVELAIECSMPGGHSCSIQFMDTQLNQLHIDFRKLYKNWRLFKSVLCEYHAPVIGGKWDFCDESKASPTAMLVEMNKLDQHQFATHSRPVLGYLLCLAPVGIVFGLVLGWACKSKRWRRWQKSEMKKPLLLA